MKKYFTIFTTILLWVSWGLHAAPASLGAQLLSSMEADPDTIIDHKVNVINGDYCEVITDLSIEGPDNLILQRYYNNSDFITGDGIGGWRIFPQCWLTVGKDPKGNNCSISGTKYDWTYAFTGERSGSILTYSGWESRTAKDEGLRVWAFRDGKSICNTARGEISGRVNPQNNHLQYQSDNESYVLTLGDGTKRFFEKVDDLPSRYLGEELHANIAEKLRDSESHRLTLEILPSGNKIRYSYDLNGHLARVEMSNSTEEKIFSCLQLNHQLSKKQLIITTSDERELRYELDGSLITKAFASYQPEVSYGYNKAGKLTRRILPGKTLEIEYDARMRVACLKEALGTSKQLTSSKTFAYGNGFTEVCNAIDKKTTYRYNSKEQLEAIEHYDLAGSKYRVDRKFWELQRERCCLLVAKTIEDGQGNTLSCRNFSYDQNNNVIEEKLYGNLTGKSEAFLRMGKNGKIIADEEDDCHVKTTEYSQNGLNLITKVGDCKGNETIFEYIPGTNRIAKKFIKDNKQSSYRRIQKRLFYTYNEDGVLTQIIEDDGYDEQLKYNSGVTERHITNFTRKEHLPGVGLPLEVVEQYADIQNQFTPTLLKKTVNVIDSQGRVLKEDTYSADNSYAYSKTWEYDAHGNLSKESNQEGKETLYAYDALGNCILKQTPIQGITTEFVYDQKGRIIETRESYEATQYTLTNTYDPIGRKLSSTDRYGNQTDFEYDVRGFLSKVTYPAMKDQTGQVSRPSVSYENDLFGNPLKTTDAKGYVMLKRFNLRGDPVSIDYPDGTFELFKYDPEGSVHRHLTRDKIISVFEYDFLGRQSNVERSTASKNGSGSWIDNLFCKYSTYHLKSVKDKGAIACYEYDDAGRLSKMYRPSKGCEEDDAKSRKEEYTYDSLGRVIQKKIFFDKGENDYSIEHMEYDLGDRVIEKRVEDALGVLLQASRFIYDSKGLLIEELSLLNGKFIPRVRTTYNDLGEPTSIIDAEGKETHFIYEATTDEAGQQVVKKTIVDPSGVSTEMLFDAFHRVVSLRKLSPEGSVLSQQQTTYDTLRNKVLEENTNIAEASQQTQVTSWVMGPMSRIEEMHEAVGTDQERITHYTYGDDGKVSSKLLPGMETPITYTYNKEGKLYKIYYREGKDDLHVSNTYSYDRKGNVTSAHSLHGTSVSRRYNKFDQIIEETFKDEGSEYSVHYDYDRKGRITLIRLPDGSKIQYTYDALHGKSVSRISPHGSLLYSHEYLNYDEWGRLKEEKHLGFVGHKKKEWSLGNQLISVESEYYKEHVPHNGYDALGHLLSLQREGDFNPQDLSFTYNFLSQITSENGESDKTYSFDSIGNRITKNDERYQYDHLNQLVKTPQDQYEYDPRGCLTKRSRNDLEWNFESNVLGQLIRIAKEDNTALEFSYDPFGRLLTKKHFDVSGKYKKKLSIARHLYVGDQEIALLEESGEISELCVPGIHNNTLGQESVAFEIRGKTLAPLFGMRGNVVALVDPQWREVVESYTYSAFGECKIFDTYGEELEESALGNSWTFSGKRKDFETGFFLFGLRFYDPVIGRWISPDPALFIDGPNLYAFAQNNPLHYLDRFGLSTENRNSEEFENYFYGEVESHCFCERHRTCKRGGDLGNMSLTYGPESYFVIPFESFESPFTNKSKIYNLSAESLFQELPKGMIMFINGMNTAFDEAQSHSQYIGNMAGGYNIHGIYNATHGAGIDLLECALNEEYVATPPVRLLHEKWNAYFSQNGTSTPILQVCHSQGAILLRNALMSYPQELRNRIIVVAVAPGAYIHPHLCQSVIHFTTNRSRDLVPFCDPFGRIVNSKNVVILPAHEDASLHDHGFQSPTYNQVILRQIRNYTRTYGGVR